MSPLGGLDTPTDDGRRNYSSSNTRNNSSLNASDARSRGISGVSGDLNLALNQTQASHSSNDGCEQALRSTVADKVRGVRFAVRAESPSDRKRHYIVMTSEIEESSTKLKEDNS